jgi:hypothetical protein
MNPVDFDSIVTHYTAQGKSEFDLMDAEQNAIECCVDCEGQTYSTVHDWIQTEEGNAAFCKYLIASIEG